MGSSSDSSDPEIIESQSDRPSEAYPPPSYPPQVAPPYNNPQPYPPVIIEPSNPEQLPLQINPGSTAIIIGGESSAETIFGPMPSSAYCKDCNLNVTTLTQVHVGCFVWLMFLVFYLVSPCVSCIPFCIIPFYDVSHHCPKCSRKLGTFALV
ncbi:hypothetical protein SteCoe_19626 [Stentor coeruleus]|uniref:LITAF domain-containing protein n=1 Tax=Stentor coeruleus TaxID=5963 RepID=A0A1R2BTM6_9CILI|nr:hypothetical protein SteCoe_19626 [Stentor coeruleus]